MNARVLTSLALPVLTSLALTQADGCSDPAPPELCPRAASSADGVRRVVVSKPYDAAGKASNLWEVLTLGLDGVLTRTGTTFTMGRATSGSLAFTPDGKIGVAALEDGSLGVFQLEDSGAVTVLAQSFKGSFYAGAVAMDPTGARVWVLDGNWPENGGGIYSVLIGCDGTLFDEGLFAEAKLAWAFGLVPGSSEAVVGATLVGDSAPHADAHRIRLGDPMERLASGDAFGDDEAFVASVAVTYDGQYALLSDNNEFSGVGSRVAVVRLDTQSPVQVLTGLEDPVEVLASPFGDAALVVSGYGNALLKLAYAPTATVPFSKVGALTYVGAKPQLPGDAVLVERGSLTGLVLVVENQGLRRVQFLGGGQLKDLGLTLLGSSYTAIPGALGVQP